MAERYQEYLRRNLLHAKACGAKANASTALKRLEMQTRPPQWLVNALRGILERVDPLPAELARWRDLAPDTPDFVRAEMETPAAPARCQCGRYEWGPDYKQIEGSDMTFHYADRECRGAAANREVTR